MNTSTEKTPYLTLDFGEEFGKFIFWTNEEALQWVTKEQAEWSWVQHHNWNPTRNAWSIFGGNLSSAISSLRNASHHEQNNQPFQHFVQEAKTHIERAYVNEARTLLPNNATREFLFNLKSSGQESEAALIVAMIFGQDLRDAPLNIAVSALLLYYFFKNGIKNRTKGESEALKKLSSEFKVALSSQSFEHNANRSSFESLRSAIESYTENIRNEFEKSQATRQEEWEKELDKARKDLEALTETYDNHMKLAAPVSYWEKKRVKHRNWSLGFFIFIGIAMLWFGNLLVAELESVGKAVEALKAIPAAKNAASSAAGSMIEFASTWKIGSFVLLATLGFWVIRILVRLFLSHIHLENDAAERVTMAQTFLALKRDSSLSGTEHIGTILAALFRPTGDGIVKDEGLPPTAMEWLTKLGGNK